MTKDVKKVNELYRMNQRYVKVVAQSYTNQGLPLEELIEAGNKGLYVAAEKYDESSNNSFISYAVWWIRQRILEALLVEYRIVNNKELSDREKEILRSAIRGESLNEIAVQWGLNESRVSQILARALRKAQNLFSKKKGAK